MTARFQQEPTVKAGADRLLAMNAVLCGIGAVLYLADCILVLQLDLKATYVWLPLLCALSSVVALSIVLTVISIVVAFRRSFLVAESQQRITKLRFVTCSCASIIPLSILIVFVNCVGAFFKAS